MTSEDFRIARLSLRNAEDKLSEPIEDLLYARQVMSQYFQLVGNDPDSDLFVEIDTIYQALASAKLKITKLLINEEIDF